MKTTLITISPTVEEKIVEIARVSSSRKDKKEDFAGLINYLIKNRHWSPFEHGYMTIEIVTSKAIGIQLLRHRSFTFQEFSQRYAKVTELEPFELRQQAETNRQSSTEVFDPIMGEVHGNQVLASDEIKLLLEHTQELYNDLIEKGVAKECARMVLPMCTQTTIHMTGSIRSWIHMLQIRDDSHAQLEAQEIARACKEIFIKELPHISKALGWE